MLLIGIQQHDPRPGDYGIYAGLFRRAPVELPHTSDVFRYVGYESCAGHGFHVRFLGVEVEAVDHIPEGMVAWNLNDSAWAVLISQNGRRSTVLSGAISWQWFSAGNDSPTGEFRIERSGTDMRMTANAYFAVDGASPPDEVELVDYDPAWPDMFGGMARWLAAAIGPDTALRIEHYGSTAIPGMPAKPVIDILIEIPSFEDAKRRAIPLLNSPLWEYWWYSDHMVFIKRETFMGARTHHLHMAPAGHEVWKGIEFRDWLRTHQADAERYAGLKRRLAAEHRSDREAYTRAKGEFVEEIGRRQQQRPT
ncbi:GrpB family protein [bacterium]|nr:GrpB family protein [bacterium]